MEVLTNATPGPVWETRAASIEEAIRRIRPGARLFVHGAAATPTPLLEGLVARDLDGVMRLPRDCLRRLKL